MPNSWEVRPRKARQRQLGGVEHVARLAQKPSCKGPPRGRPRPKAEPGSWPQGPGSLTHVGGSPAFSNDLPIPLAPLRSPQSRLCIPPGLDANKNPIHGLPSQVTQHLLTDPDRRWPRLPPPFPTTESLLVNTGHLVTPSIRRLWAIMHHRLTLNQLHLHRPPPRREEIPQL